MLRKTTQLLFFVSKGLHLLLVFVAVGYHCRFVEFSSRLQFHFSAGHLPTFERHNKAMALGLVWVRQKMERMAGMVMMGSTVVAGGLGVGETDAAAVGMAI